MENGRVHTVACVVVLFGLVLLADQILQRVQT